MLVKETYDTKEFFVDFQAEDGIRDYKVTGVQTCALPIFGAEEAVDLARSDGQAHAVDGRERAVFLDQTLHLAHAWGFKRRAATSSARRCRRGWGWGRSEERRVGREGSSQRRAGRGKETGY